MLAQLIAGVGRVMGRCGATSQTTDNSSDASYQPMLTSCPLRVPVPKPFPSEASLNSSDDSSGRTIPTRSARPNDESDSGIHTTLGPRTQRREQTGQRISQFPMQQIFKLPMGLQRKHIRRQPQGRRPDVSCVVRSFIGQSRERATGISVREVVRERRDQPRRNSHE